ncbi:MAG: hypothetical protein JWQ19_632 [Subtercola sp.]|nr:hypothetical protein [Subtercola sp.]
MRQTAPVPYWVRVTTVAGSLIHHNGSSGTYLPVKE